MVARVYASICLPNLSPSSLLLYFIASLPPVAEARLQMQALSLSATRIDVTVFTFNARYLPVLFSSNTSACCLSAAVLLLVLVGLSLSDDVLSCWYSTAKAFAASRTCRGQGYIQMSCSSHKQAESPSSLHMSRHCFSSARVGYGITAWSVDRSWCFELVSTLNLGDWYKVIGNVKWLVLFHVPTCNLNLSDADTISRGLGGSYAGMRSRSALDGFGGADQGGYKGRARRS